MNGAMAVKLDGRVLVLDALDASGYARATSHVMPAGPHSLSLRAACRSGQADIVACCSGGYTYFVPVSGQHREPRPMTVPEPRAGPPPAAHSPSSATLAVPPAALAGDAGGALKATIKEKVRAGQLSCARALARPGLNGWQWGAATDQEDAANRAEQAAAHTESGARALPALACLPQSGLARSNNWSACFHCQSCLVSRSTSACKRSAPATSHWKVRAR
jgi:hypothetical protein